jgi:hypothetical protein
MAAHFEIRVAGAASDIASVALLRSDHNAHSFTGGDRYVKLAFEATRSAPGDLRVTSPALPAQAVPGVYLLFVVDRNGVPSRGRRSVSGRPPPVGDTIRVGQRGGTRRAKALRVARRIARGISIRPDEIDSSGMTLVSLQQRNSSEGSTRAARSLEDDRLLRRAPPRSEVTLTAAPRS